MAETLLQAGYRTRQATDSGQLLAESLGGWSLLVVDLDDKRIDNRFLRTVTERNPDLPVIGISDHTYHPNLKEAMSEGLRACLLKPVKNEEFIYLIKGLTNSEVSRNGNGGG
jgi:DNA-binding NtrC family response regulator